MKCKKIAPLFVLILFLYSCKKTDLKVNNQKDSEGVAQGNSSFFSRDNTSSPACYDCSALQSSYSDSIENPTVLGAEIQNPYTLPNMTQAYNNMYGAAPSLPLTASHLYVKFTPSSFTQLATLEDEDIDMTDFPLDREVTFEGDYYVQPGKSPEDLPDMYAVVPANYQFPAGIPYTVITEMYIPDNVPVWEDEALYLTGNLGDDNTNNTFENGETNYEQVRARRLSERLILPCDMTPCAPGCPLWGTPECGGNGGGGSGGGGGNASCAYYPSGRILVQNELATDHSYRGVRNIRVVIRRTFKIQRLFTDNNGRFVTTKYFRNKFTILTKFKNDLARIARMRPWALWEQFFPIKINFGRWKNLDCNHEFLIPHTNVTSTIATSHWVAAVTHNGIIEHKEMCQQEGVGLPPDHLHILLSKTTGSPNGNTYMYNHILKTGGSIPIVLLTHMVQGVGLLWAIRAPDIVYGYGGDPYFLKTDQYCELVYHELSHAGHYNQVGNLWWIVLGLAEYSNLGPGYGPCCNSYADIIAVAEGWAYHMGHYLADKKWGFECTTFPEQGNRDDFSTCLFFTNSSTYSSQHNFLEQYNPTRFTDAQYWIPKGFFNDMMDGGLEPTFQSTIQFDNVSGYTNAQFYNALTSDVADMATFRDKLLLQNNFWQQADVIQLLNQYGY